MTQVRRAQIYYNLKNGNNVVASTVGEPMTQDAYMHLSIYLYIHIYILVVAYFMIEAIARSVSLYSL